MCKCAALGRGRRACVLGRRRRRLAPLAPASRSLPCLPGAWCPSLARDGTLRVWRRLPGHWMRSVFLYWLTRSPGGVEGQEHGDQGSCARMRGATRLALCRPLRLQTLPPPPPPHRRGQRSRVAVIHCSANSNGADSRSNGSDSSISSSNSGNDGRIGDGASGGTLRAQQRKSDNEWVENPPWALLGRTS